MSISSISSYNATLSYLSLTNVEKSQSTSQSQTVSADQQRQSQSYGNSSASQASKVSLSADALFTLTTVSQSESIVPNKYEQFFPTRDGFSVSNLAAAVDDPSAEPFTQNRPFSEVIQATRENLDSKYQQMEDSGQAYEKNTFEGVDRSALFGELDRRALYAVASNQGGLFSEDEQKSAQTFMTRQQGLSAGFYSGPQRLEANYSHSAMQDGVLKSKASIQFLDQVSPEEKSSMTWAYSRAVAESHYEIQMSDRGEVGEDLSSENPLVQLIKAALDAWADRPDITGTGSNVNSKEDLLKEPWFLLFEDQLDDAIAKTQELYGVSE